MTQPIQYTVQKKQSSPGEASNIINFLKKENFYGES